MRMSGSLFPAKRVLVLDWRAAARLEVGGSWECGEWGLGGMGTPHIKKIESEGKKITEADYADYATEFGSEVA